MGFTHKEVVFLVKLCGQHVACGGWAWWFLDLARIDAHKEVPCLEPVDRVGTTRGYCSLRSSIEITGECQGIYSRRYAVYPELSG